MVACSDTYYADDYRNYDKEFGREQDEEVGVDSIEWDTVRLELGGKFNLASVLEPVQLNISALNKKLERQQTVSARIDPYNKKRDILTKVSMISCAAIGIRKIRPKCILPPMRAFPRIMLQISICTMRSKVNT